MKNIRFLVLPLLVAAAANAWSRAAEPSSTTSAASTKATKSGNLFDDSVIVKGNGLEIKRGQLDAEFIRAKTAYTSHGQMAPPDLERQVLDNLIGYNLILAKATPQDKAAGKELFTKNLQKVKDEGKLSEAEFNDRLNRQLLLQDLTKEQWEKQNIDQATIQLTLERELNVKVTDADVKKFYDENPGKFEEQEKVRASHILLSTRDRATSTELTEEQKAAKRKKAEELVKRARAGEDFAKLAKEYSEDPGSKDKGGEYIFPRGQMVPEFEAAAFSLKPNEVSDVVTTQFGYHIIKLSEKIPAKKAELTEVAPRIKEFLTQQDIQKALPVYVAKLREAAKVEILDEKLKASAENLGLPAGHPAVGSNSKSGGK